MPFTSSPSPFSLTSFTNSIALKTQSAVDYETRFGRCEHSIAPLSRRAARERMASDPAALLQDDDDDTDNNIPLHKHPEVTLKRQLTALNDPIVRQLLNAKEVEDKIIALDYRLKLDMCLRC
mmetsp:Transcript_23143/g.38255  ORF Transcript_23143/g.38255 Transcript_23143/m.38255 type:complete len:122 (-) Transcript_23143:328-693(-)|eukprot:CAMPEP_0119012722 /NCGR_PEP_ID=MMETSP1176-20130426/7347_1 /TAXON_ID=265551 /ORGANISM="Synedropsis recta cf, Strain CCMP1620" /LENGTH=121 /DNA_ID=CAMNT_0006965735 /DNA_START=71 /DNA_END=436 /DNA_ORIENTATION=-